MNPAYAELAAATNFSFLRGASHARDMVLTALLLGQAGLGIADRNTVAGVVRAHAALAELKQAGQAPPLKVREGSGPGEYRILDSPSAAPLMSDGKSVQQLFLGTPSWRLRRRPFSWRA